MAKLIVLLGFPVELISWIAARRVQKPPASAQTLLPMFASPVSPELLTVNVTAAAGLAMRTRRATSDTRPSRRAATLTCGRCCPPGPKSNRFLDIRARVPKPHRRLPAYEQAQCPDEESGTRV